ncbi:hypothetical protein SDJN02_26641 [Cucurbita argyrosperma subsp. argyrosperma]|nr:hypothetical protein SDJN02_26641 [Cucurbita argyrosperma subsp. argyrosperma]
MHRGFFEELGFISLEILRSETSVVQRTVEDRSFEKENFNWRMRPTVVMMIKFNGDGDCPETRLDEGTFLPLSLFISPFLSSPPLRRISPLPPPPFILPHNPLALPASLQWSAPSRLPDMEGNSVVAIMASRSGT